MSDEFRAYKSKPTSDGLIRLLRAHQDRVYRLCFHVLRRAHDAEDAAQEVLIKIVDAVQAFDDPDAFRRWVHRVSLNAALEAARKAARRRAHETRVLMKEPPKEPLDDETRLALFEAIARLEEGPRGLLLDHYVEGETMESLGMRDGVSAQAVSKRLDRAREDLKRALPATFLVVPDLKPLFPPVPAAPELVTGAVLAKVHSVAAVLAAGGIAVTSKSTLVAAVFITAVICLTAGLGLGVLIKSRPGGVSIGRVEPPTEKGPRAGDPGAGSRLADRIPAPVSSREELKPADAPKSEGSLAARLNRYREWRLAWEREKKELGDQLILDDQFKIRHFHKKRREMCDELAGMRELILADPTALFNFLESPDNGPWLDDLIIYGLGFVSPDPDLGFVNPGKTPFDRFPSRLTQGLLDLMKAGTSAQKGAAMTFFGHVSNHPAQFEERWLSLLDDADPSVQGRAAQLVSQIPGIGPEFMTALTRVGRTSSDVWVRVAVANSMSSIRTPEAQDYLLERLDASVDANEVVSLTCALASKFYAASSGGPPVPQDKVVASSLAALNRGLGDDAVRYVIMAALFLPSDKARPVLDRARAVATTAELQDTVAAMLRKIDGGEGKREELEKLLWPKK